MKYLLESIIIYRLPLPLSKISVSLGFNDVFCCAGVRLDLGGGEGELEVVVMLCLSCYGFCVGT